MAVPNIFANVTTTIPLSQLDTNFATAITLGNTAVYLGNTTTALGNLTLNNVTIASGTASGNLSTGNVTVSGTLGVTGATTLSSTLAAGNTTITGTLSATGQSSFASTGTTTPVLISKEAASAYGALSFNSSVTTATMIGLLGTTTGVDPVLYLCAPTGGSVKTFINSTTITATTSAGLAVTGTLSATTGAAVGGATAGAGGVAFPATAVAVADANTLDDYEEGTWTPSVGGTATYSGQTGLYTKIGRMVYIQCYLDILLIGTGSTSTISGLPFASVNVQGLGMCSQFSNLNTNLIAPGFFPSGSNLRNAGLATAAANSSPDNAIFKSTTRVDFSCSYMAS